MNVVVALLSFGVVVALWPSPLLALLVLQKAALNDTGDGLRRGRRWWWPLRDLQLSLLAHGNVYTMWSQATGFVVALLAASLLLVQVVRSD